MGLPILKKNVFIIVSFLFDVCLEWSLRYLPHVSGYFYVVPFGTYQCFVIKHKHADFCGCTIFSHFI